MYRLYRCIDNRSLVIESLNAAADLAFTHTQNASAKSVKTTFGLLSSGKL